MADLTPSQRAEMSVIGALLLDSTRCEDVFGQVSPICFQSDSLRTLYESILVLHKAGTPVDVVTVLSRVGKEYNKLVMICANMAPSIKTAGAYAAIVFDEWRKRELAADATHVLTESQTAGVGADVAVDVLRAALEKQERIQAAQEDTVKNEFAACVERFLETLNKPCQALACGWGDLDRCQYLAPERIIVLAARTGSGKTDFALAWAVKLSLKKPVLYISLEMKEAELLRRITANGMQVETDRLQSGDLTDSEVQSVSNFARLLQQQTQLRIWDPGSVTPEEIDAYIRKVHPAAVFIDHLGLINVEGRYKTDFERLTYVTRFLKQCAQKNSVPIVELAQLNRTVDKSKGGQNSATMADLRGSGTIEQDADTILFVRPEIHAEEMHGNMFCTVKIDCVKHRHGARRSLTFDWMPQYSKYISVDGKHTDFEPVPESQPDPFKQQEIEGTL